MSARAAAAEPRALSPAERNLVTSYGLTLVAGLPLPFVLTRAVAAVQDKVEAAAPGAFGWYARRHLHVTLAAPLRGRYRAAPPIERVELPAGFADFLRSLARTCAELPPLALSLGPCALDHGTLSITVVGGLEHAARLRGLIAACPGFDPPEHLAGPLHLSIGFLLPGADGQAAAAAAVVRADAQGAAAAQHRGAAAQHRGAAVLPDVALVHYANRTLSAVLGQWRIPLGRPSNPRPDAVLQQLHIHGA